MKQVWNILRKDLRHHWREIAVSLALLAAYAWYDVKGWAGERGVAASGAIGGLVAQRFLSGLVTVLLPVAWAFLIVRVVQGEALVGDRQFWITRPYEWKKLLAAKILFTLVTINLPLLIVDIVLLAKAGFPPAHYITGLLWMQLLIALILILPIATLATVTASVVQTILAVLGIVLYMIGVAALASVIPSSGFSGPADPLQFALLIATCVAVILWQYARRNAVGSRWLIAGLAGAVVLILVATPYNAIVNHQFPRSGPEETPPVRLTVLPARNPSTAAISDSEKNIAIQIPLSVSAVADDAIVVLSGVKVTFERPDGWSWSSGWESPGTSLFPHENYTQIGFTLANKAFQRLRSDSIKARIAVAFTVYRDNDRKEFVTPSGEFVMPGVGICSAGTSYLRGIHCRAALRSPSSIVISSDLAATTCSAREGESRATTPQISRQWIQNSESGPAEFGISPVKTFDFILWGQNVMPSPTVTGVCPGTPLAISWPVLVQKSMTELQLNNLRLDDYRQPQPQTEGVGYAFGIR